MSSPLIRHWDPTGEYEGAVLKWYEHWCLEVSWNQHTLGSFIIFCRREGVRLMSFLRDDELLELREIQMDIEMALANHSDFRPDHFNYLQLGNTLPLLHLHGIPRYESQRTFFGREWIDPAPRFPPRWVRERASQRLVHALRNEIAPLLP